MATRATPEDVRAINGSTLDDAAIQPFIDTAHILVDSVLICANTTEDVLTQAEAWLSAHLMSVSSIGSSDGGGSSKSSESFDLYSITWGVSMATGSGVLATNYGSVANTLLNGCLAAKDKSKALIDMSGGA